jgi:copper(I)-binding protein
MAMKSRVMILFVALLLLLSACASNTPNTPQISVEDPWVRAAVAMAADSSQGGMSSDSGSMQMGGATSAVYMIIRNTGRQPDRLLTVKTDAAQAAETHITETKDGITVMSKVDGFDIPAQGQIVLEPGGKHIMLVNLNQDLKEGENLNLTLVFEKSGEIKVTVPVRNP